MNDEHRSAGDPGSRSGGREIVKAFFMAVFLFLTIFLIYRSPVGQWAHPDSLEKIKEEMESGYLWGLSFFVVASSISIGCGVPRSVIGFLAGGLLGFWAGLLFTQFASLAGSSCAIAYVRWVRVFFWPGGFQRRFPSLDHYLNKRGFLTVLFLRLVPVPGAMVNLMLGLSPIPLHNIVLASFIGFLPQNIVFCLYGSGLSQHSTGNLAMASSFLVALSVLIYCLYHHNRSAHDLMMAVKILSKQEEKWPLKK